MAFTAYEDLKYIWAAHKKGALRILGPDFNDPDYTPKELAQIYDAYMNANMMTSFTVQASNEGTFRPVGLIIVWVRGRVLQVTDMVWFPWASPRNIFECTLKFFDQIRRMEHKESGRDFIIIEYAREQDKKYFERMMDLGILRRCGKMFGLYEDQEAIIYYTNEV